MIWWKLTLKWHLRQLGYSAISLWFILTFVEGLKSSSEIFIGQRSNGACLSNLITFETFFEVGTKTIWSHFEVRDLRKESCTKAVLSNIRERISRWYLDIFIYLCFYYLPVCGLGTKLWNILALYWLQMFDKIIFDHCVSLWARANKNGKYLYKLRTYCDVCLFDCRALPIGIGTHLPTYS